MTAERSGRRILVLGVGIAQAIAITAAARGDAVTLASRTRPSRSPITHLLIDLATAEGPEQAVGQGIDQLGGIDVLVTCVGARVVRASFAEHSDDDWCAAFIVNVMGTVRACRRGLPALLDSKGVLVNIMALHDPLPNPQVAPYSAAEAAIEAITRALAVEVTPHGGRVFGVAPEATTAQRTVLAARQAQTAGHGTAALLSIVGGSGARVPGGDGHRRMPMIEFVQREDAARLILRLIDDPAATGATYLIDSGMLPAGL